MATVPVRAKAHLPLIEQPPPCRHGMRVRSASSMLLSVFLAGLLPGVILGMVIGPPSSERCAGAPDTIACLIVTLD